MYLKFSKVVDNHQLIKNIYDKIRFFISYLISNIGPLYINIFGLKVINKVVNLCNEALIILF